MTDFDYVTVGHVTVDVLVAGATRRPGGGAFYSALQAARLGLRTLIVTRGSPTEIERLLEPYRAELELRILAAPATTTLATSGTGAARTQRVLAWAGPIAEAVTVDTGILHFAPVAREIAAATWRGHADFVGLTPQGLARAWDRAPGAARETGHGAGRETEHGTAQEMGPGATQEPEPRTAREAKPDAPRTAGELVTAPLPIDRSALRALLPRGCDAVVLSEQERTACAPLLAVAAAAGATIAITAGAGATRVQSPNDEVTKVQAPTVADQQDDLGAGDVFAAAFFVALHEGRTPAGAAAFGNAAAAIRVEGEGAGAIGDRRAIEARLAGGRDKR